MSNWLIKLWNSRTMQTFVGILGLLGLFINLMALAFPSMSNLIRWIATGFLVFAALFLAYPLFNRMRGRLITDEDVYQRMAKRYGLGYGNLQVECRIKADGSAEVQREVTVEAFSVIDQLDTFLLVPEPDLAGREARTIDRVRLRSLADERSVTLMHSRSKEGILSTTIGIFPPLKEGEILTYELTEKLPLGLYAVDEQTLAKRNTPYDYFGWNINRPTRKLSMRIYFPSSVMPDINSDGYGVEVRYAAAAPGLFSQRQQYEEQKRLKRPLLVGPEGKQCLKLDVDYPMIGLIYILRWQPLVKESRGKH